MTEISPRVQAALDAGHDASDGSGISGECEKIVLAAIAAYEAWTPEPTKRAKPTSTKADFDAFWALYPRKSGKLAARRKFETAARTSPVAEIIAGLKRYKFSDDPQFIPMPVTWLHQGRWMDEPDAPAAPPAPKPPPNKFSPSAGRTMTSQDYAELGL